MKKEALKRIFEFLEEKENKLHIKKGTLMWKLSFNEPLTEKELNVKGHLVLSNPGIETLPEGLKVRGSLILHKTNIKSLPKGLEVGGDLDLTYSNIESLPEGLKVGRGLYLSNSKITSLPKGLEVGRNLNIRFTPLTKYLDDELKEMIQPGFIKGEIIR